MTGGCCCESVAFKLKDDLVTCFFCHYEQCRKLTGSAHASNLFTFSSNIEWTKGEDKIKCYDHPTRLFPKIFVLIVGQVCHFGVKVGNS
ncbi:GFA family protein [Aeromonas hydrophila]|uniref:GFA family protein n=1 Tax=Aeromonas hydrophila TaxID=644 RepID=UPI0035BA0227